MAGLRRQYFLELLSAGCCLPPMPCSVAVLPKLFGAKRYCMHDQQLGVRNKLGDVLRST